MEEAAKATIPKQMWLSLDRLLGRNFLSSYAYKDVNPFTKLTAVKTIATSAKNKEKNVNNPDGSQNN